MEEIWKPIKDFEGNYLISNFGRIKSVPHLVTYKGRSYMSKERIMSLQHDAYGYLQVRLSKNAVKKTRKVHRLVAIAFIPNPHNLPEINHKDENKTNNFVYIKQNGTVDFEKSNLEWCDRNYNMQYGINTHWHRMPVAQYTIDGKFIRRYDSIKEASKETGIYSTNIANCASKRIINKEKGYIVKTAGGYKWELL